MENNNFIIDHKDLAGKRILVAEDNLLNQIILKKILEKWDVHFQIAPNGNLAVDAFSNGEFDIILMDIQMPELDGYSACRKIRSLVANNASNIPIIALTASVNEELQDLVKSSGMNDILIKPYAPEALYEKLCKYLKA